MGTSHFRNWIILSTSVYFIRLLSKILLVCTRAHHRCPTVYAVDIIWYRKFILSSFFLCKYHIVFLNFGGGFRSFGNLWFTYLFLSRGTQVWAMPLQVFSLLQWPHLPFSFSFFRLTYFLKSKTIGLCTWNKTSSGLVPETFPNRQGTGHQRWVDCPIVRSFQIEVVFHMGNFLFQLPWKIITFRDLLVPVQTHRLYIDSLWFYSEIWCCCYYFNMTLILQWIIFEALIQFSNW